MHEEEKVGAPFDLDKLREAQRVTWQVLEAVAHAVRPGHRLKDLHALLAEAMAQAGVAKAWHPPQLRLGPSTACAFNQPAGGDAPLASDDIFFLDLGLVVGGHEGDCGRTFTLGANADMQRCAADAQRMHGEGLAYWRRTRCSGSELYRWGQARARELGWVLGLAGAHGHRVGDLPHHHFFSGYLSDRDYTPASDRWIYEVQLLDPSGRFGAFYEDLLS